MHDQISLAPRRDRLSRLFDPHGWGGSIHFETSDGPDRQHVRMFVLSHVCGPLIGLALSAFLLLLGFPLDLRLIGFTALICLFWAYPAALALGASYRFLSVASLQHLTFAILWASHGYGGLTSPFLLWLAVVPLLAFLYSAPSIRLWLVLLAMLGLSTASFAAFSWLVAVPPPVGAQTLRWLALVSLLSASTYVSMMAIYFGRVLSSRNQMAQEVARSRAAVTDLEQQVAGLRQARAARIASLSRLVRQCRAPVEDISASCSDQLESAADRTALDASDLTNIRSAAARIGRLIERAEQYSATLTERLAGTERA